MMWVTDQEAIKVAKAPNLSKMGFVKKSIKQCHNEYVTNKGCIVYIHGDVGVGVNRQMRYLLQSIKVLLCIIVYLIDHIYCIVYSFFYNCCHSVNFFLPQAPANQD